MRSKIMIRKRIKKIGVCVANYIHNNTQTSQHSIPSFSRVHKRTSTFMVSIVYVEQFEYVIKVTADSTWSRHWNSNFNKQSTNIYSYVKYGFSCSLQFWDLYDGINTFDKRPWRIVVDLEGWYFQTWITAWYFWGI